MQWEKNDRGDTTNIKESFKHQHLILHSSHIHYTGVPSLPFVTGQYTSTPCLIVFNTVHLSYTVAAHQGWGLAAAPFPITTTCVPTKKPSLWWIKRLTPSSLKTQRALMVQPAEAKAPGRSNCILKGAYKKNWRGTSTWVCSDRTGGMVLRWKMVGLD